MSRRVLADRSSYSYFLRESIKSLKDLLNDECGITETIAEYRIRNFKIKCTECKKESVFNGKFELVYQIMSRFPSFEDKDTGSVIIECEKCREIIVWGDTVTHGFYKNPLDSLISIIKYRISLGNCVGRELNE